MACPIDWNVENGPQPSIAMNGAVFANADQDFGSVWTGH